MASEKFKIKVNVSQLRELEQYVGCAAALKPSADQFNHKLLVACMISLHKKILAKWNYPTPITKITMTASEAIAFFLMFNNEDFSGAAYAEITIKNICRDIHKTYI